MPCSRKVMIDDFELLRYGAGEKSALSRIGSLPSPNNNNLVRVGETFKGRITPGDSLEPDVLGSVKGVGSDVSSMWIGFFDFPDGEITIETGDYIRDINDPKRIYQAQFVDKYPGGVHSHHYEVRLQTTEVFRNRNI